MQRVRANGGTLLGFQFRSRLLGSRCKHGGRLPVARGGLFLLEVFWLTGDEQLLYCARAVVADLKGRACRILARATVRTQRYVYIKSRTVRARRTARGAIIVVVRLRRIADCTMHVPEAMHVAPSPWSPGGGG
eukprot:6225726-Prymnesium_polylepis.1